MIGVRKSRVGEARSAEGKVLGLAGVSLESKRKNKEKKTDASRKKTSSDLFCGVWVSQK